MAKIHNTETIKEVIDGGKIQTSSDVVPTQLADKIVPVMEVNPKLLKTVNIVRYANATNPASATTIYTTPTNQDFYLTGATINSIKTATSDLSTGVFTSLQVVINGATQRLFSANGITLTAQEHNVNMVFSPPIKIDRNSVINMAAQSAPAAGTYSRTGAIYGFLDESSLA